MKVLSTACLAITLLASITSCAASTSFAYTTIQSPTRLAVSYSQPTFSYAYPQAVLSYPHNIFTQTQFLPQGPFLQTPIYTQFPGVIGAGVPQAPATPPQYPSFPPQTPSAPPQYPAFPPQTPPQNPQFPPQSPSFPPQYPQAPVGESEADDLAPGQAPSQGGDDEDTVSIEAARSQ